MDAWKGNPTQIVRKSLAFPNAVFFFGGAKPVSSRVYNSRLPYDLRFFCLFKVALSPISP